MTSAVLASLSQELTTLTAQASSRVVGVRSPDGSSQSGIIWRNGLVVTAHEALNGEEDVWVVLGSGDLRPASLVGRDPTTDVALLRVETHATEDWPFAAVPLPGSLVLLVGRGEHSAVAGLGHVSEVGPAWRSMRGGTIDSRIKLGIRLSAQAEGGAVVAPDGKLVGMAVTGPRRSVLVIPASTIGQSVETLTTKGYIPRPYLGVTLHPASGRKGVIVTGIEDASPAAKVGLRLGDVITMWDSKALDSVRDLLWRLQGQAVGAEVRIGFERGGEAHELTITVGERPRA